MKSSTEIDPQNLVLESEVGLVYSTPKRGRVLDIRLSSEVEEPGEYLKIAQILSETTDDDYIRLHLANYGGVVDGCILLINAIHYSPAPCEVIVHAPCYSCGSLLALAGDTLSMRPYTTLMFHNFSTRIGGKQKEVEHDLIHSKSTIHELFKNTCVPFLTPEEYHSIINDTDITIHWNDKSLPKRIKRHFRRAQV